MRSRGALSGVLAALVLVAALLVVFLRPLDKEPPIGRPFAVVLA